MTASVLFEIRDTDTESPLAKALAEVAKLSEWDTRRRRIVAQLAIWWGTHELESCAVIEHDLHRDEQLRDRRAATRAARKAPISGTPDAS